MKASSQFSELLVAEKEMCGGEEGGGPDRCEERGGREDDKIPGS